MWRALDEVDAIELRRLQTSRQFRAQSGIGATIQECRPNNLDLALFMLLEVVPPPREHVPNSASRVRNVADIPRDDVNMQVIDRLARSGPSVESDIESIWLITLVEELLQIANQCHEVGLLDALGFPPGGYLAKRDDQGMSGANGKGVEDGESGTIRNDPVRFGDLSKRGLFHTCLAD